MFAGKTIQYFKQKRAKISTYYFQYRVSHSVYYNGHAYIDYRL